MARWVCGVPNREMLKCKVHINTYAHFFFFFGGSLRIICLRSGRVVASALPLKGWDLCLKVTEKRRLQNAKKCPGFSRTLTAKQNALSICSFFSVILSCSFRPIGAPGPADVTKQPVPSSCRASVCLFFKLKWRLVSCLKEYTAFPAGV